MDRLSFAGTMPAPNVVPQRPAGYARALQDRAGLLVGAALAGAAVAGLAALTVPPRYEAAALIQVAPSDAAVIGSPGGPASPSAGFDASILKSRAVAAPVIEQLRLGITAEPVRAPLIGALAARLSEPGQVRGAWPSAMGYAWGGERIALDTLAVPERLLNKPLTLEVLSGGAFRLSDANRTLLEGRVGESAAADGVEVLISRIDARPGTRFTLMRRDPVATVDAIASELKVSEMPGGTVRLAWQSGDRKQAADLVNGIADGYIRGQTSARRGDAAESLAFLAAELPRVQAELERAEAALTRYRSRSGSIQPTQDAQSYLQGSMEYQRQIAALRLERTKLLQRFTTDANEVKTVDSQIQQLIRERRELDERMQNLSLSERESVALTRDVKVAEDMYMTLRRKIEQLSLVQADRSSAVRIVDAAAASTVPVGVGPWPAAVAGGAAALALAVGGVMLRRRFKPVVADANEAEARLGLSMLGDVAFSDEQSELERQAELERRFGAMAAMGLADAARQRLAAPAPGTALAEAQAGAQPQTGAQACSPSGQALHDRFLLARRSPHALAVEGLRSVRAALYFGLRSAPDGVLAITSPAPGAGKTFAAVNLAVLFAEAGQRVLLIDADMRRGKVATWFGQATEPGLSDVLAGRIPVGAAVQPTVVAGLCILGAGATPANPSELLMLPTLKDALQQCNERFDLVIVDTPPVLSVADAMLVASLAGSTLLVMRADVTLPGQVDDTLKRLTRADARIAGGIINGVAQRRSNRADFATINPYLGMPLPPATPAARALERPVAAAAGKA
ncbi:polysaccharide biosynthesis tyrosine autokinase [Cupriavidus gilardii]|uniref:polysaccharide biosynthesis tyrosine autokinase n=1 Tax=Cupriavidus gilardii TaxID=82541 RepID=UPI001EE5E4F9|nr:polysaccharide biosynthesis tyrosine autokinase [Cupriavidus gilardii]MCG5261991.1 polysaccharide biosynthesis tyrosine autokinase [Cupriavidus gilardii]